MANASLSPRYWNISVYKYSPVRTVIHHLSLTSHKTKISSELCQSTSSCWRWISHIGNGEKRYLSIFFCIFNLIFIVMVKVLLSLTGNRQATDNLVLQRQTPSILVAQKMSKLVKMENKIFPHIFRTHRTLILEILYTLFRKWWVRRKRYGREKDFQGKRCLRVPNQILKDCSKTAQTFRYILDTGESTWSKMMNKSNSFTGRRVEKFDLQTNRNRNSCFDWRYLYMFLLSNLSFLYSDF